MRLTKNQLFSVAIFGLALCFFAGICSAEAKQVVFPGYWTLTRSSDVVLKAVVISAGKTVRLEVVDVLKGQAVGEVIEFSAPAVAKTIPGKFDECQLTELQFPVGNVIIVFLNKTESDGYKPVHTDVRALEAIEQCVRDVLKFDAMTGGDRDKCRMLVDLAISREGFSSGGALQELDKYNRPEFFELLEPLGDRPDLRGWYLHLLTANENPAATDKLLYLLRKGESANIIVAVIKGLQRKSRAMPKYRRKYRKKYCDILRMKRLACGLM